MRSLSARISLFVTSGISLGNGTATIVLSVKYFPNYNNKSDFCTFDMILNVNELDMLLPIQIILVHC